ncbi:MAG: hypothetical protein IK079_02635, partial [Desulfovibrio sp.]|nr:hypothetical protein [Desulfovibrio sp.]
MRQNPHPLLAFRGQLWDIEEKGLPRSLSTEERSTLALLPHEPPLAVVFGSIGLYMDLQAAKEHAVKALNTFGFHCNAVFFYSQNKTMSPQNTIHLIMACAGLNLYLMQKQGNSPLKEYLSSKTAQSQIDFLKINLTHLEKNLTENERIINCLQLSPHFSKPEL